MPAPLGQHFLTDTETLRMIAEATDVKFGETVIEIGPGTGALTRQLARIFTAAGGRRFIALERDSKLAAELPDRIRDIAPFLEVRQGNALELLPIIAQEAAMTRATYVVTGNIPYYITGRLLRIIGELPFRPRTVVLTLQREVAERLSARPPHMNLLAATVQRWAGVEVIRLVPRGAFRPAPKVDSAVVRLTPRAPGEPDDARYYAFVRALFKQPRKTVENNLRPYTAALGISKDTLEKMLADADVASSDRPQLITRETMERLARVFDRTIGN
jgi:16S rRNA (adenine1518-N6/adenine1519-N6)-dimethyltransferase